MESFKASRRPCLLEALLASVLCPRRWTVHAESIHSIMANYETLEKTWATQDTEAKARIQGVAAQTRKFTFFFGSMLQTSFPPFLRAANVWPARLLLQLLRHHQYQACTQAPHSRDFWEVSQFGETHFPLIWVWRRETPDLWSASVQGITISESSPSVSSDALTPLVCYICELRSHNLKTGT